MTTVYAHSIQQYNKWQDYLNGKYKEKDMYNLATTYWNELVAIFGWNNVTCGNEREIFTVFARDVIQPPYEKSP